MEILKHQAFAYADTIQKVTLKVKSFKKDDSESSINLFDKGNANPVVSNDKANKILIPMKPTIQLPEPVVFFSPRPVSELDSAATRLQKVYKGYRTRRNLADCAVVVEELWFVSHFFFCVFDFSSNSFWFLHSFIQTLL